jgi:hypothetical protein
MAITIAGSGIVEANLADNAVTLAKMASGTDGEILTYDASGNPTSVSVGTDGQVLTSTGAGSPPAFEAAAAGGKVLQVVQGTKTSESSSTSTTFADISLSASITPSATSKVLIIATLNATGKAQSATDSALGLRLVRGSTTVTNIDRIGSYAPDSSNHNWSGTTSISYLDSSHGGDGSTAITYKIQMANSGGAGGTVYVNGQYFGVGDSMSTIILMEVGA